MTPCEKKGYKVGQVFEYTGESNIGNRNGNFCVGDVLVLEPESSSSYPRFICIKGERVSANLTASLDNIKRIYPPEEILSDMVDITCEGKTVTISRESAKALNLI